MFPLSHLGPAKINLEMKVRRLDNNQVIKVADPAPKKSDFLQRQPKPVIGTDGKLYKDGVWVQHVEKKMSKEAADIVQKAKTPAATTEAEGAGTNSKAEELSNKQEG